MELNIYTSAGVLKTTCDPADSDTGVKEIMADNVINLSFILFENIALEVNDYVDFYGERYYCLEEYFPSQKSTVEWEYRCQFFGIEGLTRRALVLNNADGAMEADFSLTDTPENHLRLIVNNINRVLNTTLWEVGECVIGENITLDYSGVYCRDALNSLAQRCETEWWFDGLRVNLSRCEIGNSIELGCATGLLSLSRQAADNVKFFTRLFPLGSKRNIVPDQYGASRLQLPGGVKYLEQNTQYGIIEHFESAAFEKIYPRRVGAISSVRSETKTGADGKPFTIYYFADKDLNFDPNSYEIAGLVKNIYFDSGELNGRDFEVNFNSTTKEFEIITQYPDENSQLPGGGLVPKAGDKYILYNITMPTEYYALAEAEYMEAALAYMAKNNKDKAVYKAPTDYIELDERGVRLMLGQRVKLISEKYFPQTGYKLSRITRISRKLNNPNEAEIEISDVLGTGKITMITNEVTKTQEVVKGVDKRQEVSAKRQNKALTELENYLLDTEGYFDTDKFKALSIEARMLAVGLQSQNFSLSGIRVTPNSGNLTTVVVTTGTLTHASLEIEGLGSTWAIAGKTLSAPDVNKAYYIYAKCSKNTLQGTIEISETELKVEQFPNYYVFNLGVLYPLRAGETWRDYSATYGVTSVVGDQIYGGGIKALDGFNFVDLRAAAENGRFRLGSRSGGAIDYGVTEPNTLTLSNVKLVSRGGNSAYAPVYRGAWTNAELYYAGETVTYNGSTYQCKQDCPTAGIMPVNVTYWDKTVSKGTDGQPGQDGAPGTKGDKGEVGEMISGGKMLYRDPEFREGINACAVYNNSANGTVTITRIEKPVDCPTTSTHCLEIKTTGSASPGNGGFIQYINSRANAVFIQKIVAKLPVGYYLVNHANSQGDGASDTFITPVTGTGKYETYLRKVVCGVSGIFRSGGHIALDGGTAPVTWHLASATVYDITDTEKYDQAIMASQQAAENYAKAKAELAEVTAKAYADGVVDAEEARAIADATNKSNYAREAAITAAQEADKAIIIGSGKNYIPNSRFDTMDAMYSADCLGAQQTRDIILTPIGWVLAIKSPYTRFVLGDAYDFAQGDEIVISALIKSEVNTSLDFSVSHINGTGTSGWGEERASVTTEWKVVYVTFKIATDEPNNSPSVWIHPSQCHFYIAWIKLEKGNKPNGYIPFEEVKKISQRNYLQGCKFNTPEKVNLFEGAKEIVDDSVYCKVLKLSGKLSYLNYISSNNWKRDGLAQSQIMTVSMTVRSNKFSQLRLVISQGDGSYQWLPFAGNVGWFYCTPSWRTVHISFNILTDAPDADQLFILYPGYTGEDKEFYIADITLTKGNKPSLYDDTLDIQNYTIAKSVVDSAKNLGFTKIENGLIQSSHIQLRQPGGSETAGISGVQTGPAFWAGGTLSQAIAALNDPLSNDTTAIGHNGKGVLNNLVIRGAIASSFVKRTVPNYDTIFLKDQFNLCLDMLFSGSATVYLPNDSKYNGIRCLIYNARSQGWGWIVVKQTNANNYVNTEKVALGIDPGQVGCFTAILTGNTVTWYCENHDELYNTI